MLETVSTHNEQGKASKKLVGSGLSAPQAIFKSIFTLDAITEHSADMIALLNNKCVIIYCSPGFQKTTGYTLGDKLTNNLFLDEKNHTGKLLEKIIDEPNVSYTFPSRFLKKDGNYIWTEGTIINLTHLPEVGAILCNFRDISRQKMTEEALQHSEFKFRSLIDNSTDIIMMANIEGKFIYGSPSVKKQLGYSDFDYINKSVYSIIHPDSINEAEKLLQDVVQTPGKLFTIYLKLIRKNGTELWVEGLAKNLLHVPGINALVGNFRDITERRKNETVIKESIDLYRNLFNKNPLPIWLCDESTLEIMEVNEAAEKHYGYSRKEFLKMTFFGLVPPDKQQGLKQVISNTFYQNGKQVPWKHIKKNKEIIYVELLAHPIQYKGKSCYLLLANDLTENIRLQNQLVEEKINRQKVITQAAIDAQEKERQIIGRELHDNIAQVLTTAKLCLDNLEDGQADKQVIDHSSHTIGQAVEEIRKLSKTLIQSFQKEIGLKLSIEDLIDNVKLVSQFRLSLNYHIPNEQQLDDKLKMAIFRIIQEQLNNIMKHARATEVVLTLRQCKNLLDISIKDNGIGFDTKAKRKGIGITNIINRAELDNGQVLIESSPGNGCALFVKFYIG